MTACVQNHKLPLPAKPSNMQSVDETKHCGMHANAEYPQQGFTRRVQKPDTVSSIPNCSRPWPSYSPDCLLPSVKYIDSQDCIFCPPSYIVTRRGLWHCSCLPAKRQRRYFLASSCQRLEEPMKP